jgi:hypothetical protein
MNLQQIFDTVFILGKDACFSSPDYFFNVYFVYNRDVGYNDSSYMRSYRISSFYPNAEVVYFYGE